jgi:predicted O-methyltransferase YrrM|tara:strand:- start:309 stop:1001 length:693 start_codon:yes stop_codon:yes gene_type:complete
MNKIVFLVKNKASLKVIFIFLIQKFFNIFLKRKIKSFKKANQIFLKNKKISNDYFSMHAFNFYKYINYLNGNFDYLEIGTYEGNSAMFVARTFPNSKVFCVDNWNKTEEYGDQDFSLVEQNFDNNCLGLKNIVKIKKDSDNFFLENKVHFDVIYIDGHHKDFQVLKDCRNAWKYLKPGGILICDDYIWNFYKNLKENPCYSINLFLKEIKNKKRILEVSKSQIFIKKVYE